MAVEQGTIKAGDTKERSKNQKELSFGYLLGLIERDGSFQIIFRRDLRMRLRYRVCPTVQLSQKNVLLLESAHRALKTKKILSRLYNSPAQTRGGRAPCLRIEGVESVRQFIVECENERSSSGVLLCGIKLVDFYLVKAVYSIIDKKTHNRVEGRAQIIDLKFALHSFPLKLVQCDHLLFKSLSAQRVAPSRRVLSQKDWERRHQLSDACSLNSSDFLKDQVYRKYIDFVQSVLSRKISLSPDFVSGVLEGDGCLYTDAKRAKECSMSLAAERGSETLLLCVARYLKDESPIFNRVSKKNCTYYLVRRKNVLVHLCAHLRLHPILFKEDSQRRFLERCGTRGLLQHSFEGEIRKVRQGR